MLAATTCPACPACSRSLGQVLPFLSQHASVTYYRCACGHVWNVDKRDDSRIKHVTSMTGTADVDPWPLKCPECRNPLVFQHSRTVIDDATAPYRVDVFSCAKHGYFHHTPHDSIVKGM